jgi:hypothetical protein
MPPTTGWTGRSRHREPAPTFPLGFADDVPYDHDPLDPHPEHPTPIQLVLALTRSERETRVDRLVQMAWNRYDQAVDLIGKNIIATCSLVSGGNDSYTVAHIFRSVATHQVHANTGTGIEATREFVRAQAGRWNVPLLEVHPKPGEGYFDLVRGKVMARSRKTGELVQAWAGGFPGPAAHQIMYTRLKERGLEQIPHVFDISGSRTERALFIAGRRRAESKRRATVPHVDIDGRGTTPWASPIAIWQKPDLLAYRIKHMDSDTPVPTNPVARTLGLSAECGCLANATAGEPELWREVYPTDPFILAVNECEADLAPRTDILEHRKRWGWASYVDDWHTLESEPEPAPLEGLCSVNCGPDPIADWCDPLFDEVSA